MNYVGETTLNVLMRNYPAISQVAFIGRFRSARWRGCNLWSANAHLFHRNDCGSFTRRKFYRKL